jgi:hypothetical protein
MKSLRDTFTAKTLPKESYGVTKNTPSLTSFDLLAFDYLKSNSKVRHPEYHLGGGIVLTTNQLLLPHSQLPFGVRYDAKKSAANLSHKLLIPDLSELTIARFINQGFSEPKYLHSSPDAQVFTMKSQVYPSTSGFHLLDGALVFTDLFGIVFFPTYQLVMLLIALQPHFPSSARILAMSHFKTSPTSLGLRLGQVFDINQLYLEYCPSSLLESDHGASTSKTNQDKYTPQAGEVPVENPNPISSIPDYEEFINGPDHYQTAIKLLCHLGSFNNYFHTSLAIVLFYVLLRVFVDIVLTFRFFVGLVFGLLIPKPSFKFAYPPQRIHPSYVPQSGEAETLEIAPESADFVGAKTNEMAAAEAAPTPLATNKDHSSCCATATTVSSLPTTGYLSNTSTGFATGLKTSSVKTPTANPSFVSRQRTSDRLGGFGV